ncbi:suppressor of fused homolog isoform X2 [Physella acuta]|uniref:suppressor of fused homolog isoform X2 n=1 Tax=Physella acuta TaxID=109671 RepID=UPI0027DAFF9C|nr:suppressor of fused homolog isoform X2 [Physella acuta]
MFVMSASAGSAAPMTETVHSMSSSSEFGIEAIDRALYNLYPNNNPSSISSPSTKICVELGVSPHWHYVTYGLSDLYGDGRVHDFSGRGHPSGYGFELTFRLKKDQNDKQPPVWPVMLLNTLGLYVFNTDTEFREYDHIPWYDSLDKVAQGRSCNVDIIPCPSSSVINHMIIVEDPQILNLDTPHGTVQFLQVAGVLKEEFHYARSWKASGIVEQLMQHPQVGPLMITDMRRKVSVFDLNPRLIVDIISKIEVEGSLLARVTSHISWKEIVEDEATGISRVVERLTLNDAADSSNLYYTFRRVCLEFDATAGELLPLMVRGRLKHGLSFMFISPGCYDYHENMTIEFVPYNIIKSNEIFVDETVQMKANIKTHHLQIFCIKELIDKMDQKFTELEKLKEDLKLLPMRFMFKSPSIEIVFGLYHVLLCKKNQTTNEAPQNT